MNGPQFGPTLCNSHSAAGRHFASDCVSGAEPCPSPRGEPRPPAQCPDLLYEVHRSHRWKVHRNERPKNGRRNGPGTAEPAASASPIGRLRPWAVPPMADECRPHWDQGGLLPKNSQGPFPPTPTLIPLGKGRLEWIGALLRQPAALHS